MRYFHRNKTTKPRVYMKGLFLVLLALVFGVISPYSASAKLKIDPSANDIIIYDKDDCAGSSSGSSELVGNTNLEKIYNYLLGKGLSTVQAAGAVGNIAQESGGEPTIVQGGGKSSDPSGISAGWGIIQWTPGSKILGIAQAAGITGDIASLETQLEILWWHMTNTSPTGVKNFLEEYKTVTDVEHATRLYEQKMEGAGVPAMANRIAAAKNALSYEQNPTAGGDSVSSATGCVCNTDSSEVDVVIDPGHSGIDKQGQEIDPDTKLYIGDSNNSPEIDQVWETSEKIKTQLEQKGYTVKMTKDAVSDYKNFVERATVANEANAKIAVSIHNTPGTFGDASSGWVTEQKVGGYRTNTDGTNITFDDQPTADKSAEYASKILEERQKVEGGVQMHDIAFDGRPGLSAGNLSVVQLLAKVPWVYNEVGQTGFDSDKYATGIANGIMVAIEPSGSPSSGGSSNDSGCNGAAAGNAVKTALNYAWPEYHSPPYITAKSSYQSAVKQAMSNGKYVGGGSNPGIDCGGFVTRVMQDSQVDPEYNNQNGNTIAQEAYLSSSSKYTKLNVSSTEDLKPGDIAVNDHHTYMYVGPGLTGSDDAGNSKEFGTSIASASYGNGGTSWRAPMAGHEQPGDPEYRWFRLTGASDGE